MIMAKETTHTSNRMDWMTAFNQPRTFARAVRCGTKSTTTNSSANFDTKPSCEQSAKTSTTGTLARRKQEKTCKTSLAALNRQCKIARRSSTPTGSMVLSSTSRTSRFDLSPRSTADGSKTQWCIEQPTSSTRTRCRTIHLYRGPSTLGTLQTQISTTSRRAKQTRSLRHKHRMTTTTKLRMSHGLTRTRDRARTRRWRSFWNLLLLIIEIWSPRRLSSKTRGCHSLRQHQTSTTETCIPSKSTKPTSVKLTLQSTLGINLKTSVQCSWTTPSTSFANKETYSYRASSSSRTSSMSSRLATRTSNKVEVAP